MKKLCAVLILLLAAGVAHSAAQTKFELGTSISYYSIKFDVDTESISYLNVPIRFGWYFWKGFEIEPEFQLFVPLGADAGDAAYFVQGHLLYNFGSGGIVPFIGGGAGVGNGIPYLGIIEGGPDDKSFGYVGMAGVKFMVAKAAAIRLEYRFNRMSWEYPDFIDPLILIKEWANLHNILVGVSVFF
jgi:opacity protein-like surface antigen